MDLLRTTTIILTFFVLSLVLFFGAHLSSIPSVKPKVMSVEKMHQSLTHEQGTKKKSESPTRSSQSVHRDETSIQYTARISNVADNRATSLPGQ